MFKETEWSEKDFPEDMNEHGENMYYCYCSICQSEFRGYKRRIFCKICEQREDSKMNKSELLKHATHICKECGAFWRFCPKSQTGFDTDTWSLKSESCGDCCNNKEMGEQIVTLADHIQQLEAEKARLEERRMEDIEKAHYAGQRFVKDVPPSTHAAMAYYYGMIDKELLKEKKTK